MRDAIFPIGGNEYLVSFRVGTFFCVSLPLSCISILTVLSLGYYLYDEKRFY